LAETQLGQHDRESRVSNNDPSDVNGSECAIQEGCERRQVVACDEENVTVRTVSEATLQRLREAVVILRGRENQTVAVGYIQTALSTVEQVEFVICPFDDEVAVQVDDGSAWWECPVCRTQHEMEPG
jgi:hypothetical protein